MRRSTDGGVTRSAPVEITSTFEKFRPASDWKVLATGPDHCTQLKNGRLVVPVWLSTGTGGNAHRPSVVSTIFNDLDASSSDPWVVAAEYLGTKGFFYKYNARAADPLKLATGKAWAAGLASLRAGNHDANALARIVAEADKSDSPTISRKEFAALFSADATDGATIVTAAKLCNWCSKC